MAKPLFLTPNRRLATFLQAYEPQTWVLALDTWVEQLYQKLVDTYPSLNLPRRLNIHEEWLIWTQIVRQSLYAEEILGIKSLVEGARAAWILVHEWQLGAFDPSMQTQNIEAYQSWAEDYQAHLQEHACVDAVLMLDYLIDAIHQGRFRIGSSGSELPTHIICVAFEEMLPQHQRLFEAMAALGVSCQQQDKGNATPAAGLQNLETGDPEGGDPDFCFAKTGCRRGQDPLNALARASAGIPGAQQYQWQAADADQELSFIATAVQAHLIEYPQHRIGVVIPDLAQKRALVRRVFASFLTAETFRISAPLPLTEYPIIEAAFLALSAAATDAMLLEDWSIFLRCPFFADAIDQMEVRAQWDIVLRRSAAWTLRWEEFLEIIVSASAGIAEGPKSLDTGAPVQSPAGWMACIEACIVQRADLAGQKSAREWAAAIAHWLQTLGWPGQRSLNTEEAGLVVAWQHLLDCYQGLDPTLGLHTFGDALAQLRTMAAHTLFLPPDAGFKAPVQILGLLEALAIPFDRLWVSGMSADQWPAAPSPNPFIPAALQRAHSLPHASAARELQMAQAIIQRLSQSAAEVIFSASACEGDRVARMSPLLAHLPLYPHGNSIAYPSLLGRVAAYRSFEPDFAESGPPLTLPLHFKGGAQALQLQSLCPFRAFAETRLMAQPLKVAEQGLSAAERGTLCHRVLERVWKKLRTQSALLNLSEVALDILLKKAIARSCAEPVFQKKLAGAYGRLEQERLLLRLKALMVIEKKRAPFEAIAIEASKNMAINGFRFQIRIDRVDQIAEGMLLIDYKTGRVSLQHWFGDRLHPIQLPLYGMSQGAVYPAGLSFVSLHPEQLGFRGVWNGAHTWSGLRAFGRVSAQQDRKQGIKADKEQDDSQDQSTALDWSGQWRTWQQQIEHLVLDFANGVAKVDPMEGPKTCMHCALKTLCRVPQC